MEATAIATVRERAERRALVPGGPPGLLGADAAYRQVRARDGMCGGFSVAALAQAGRADETARWLAWPVPLNRHGGVVEVEFTEWFGGQAGQPRGFAGPSRSVARHLPMPDAVARGEARRSGPATGGGRTPGLAPDRVG
jgi:hypothetical protein